MKSTTLRRAAALSAGAALALGVTVAGPAAQAAPIAKPAGADPSPAAVGAAYLAKQPEANGIVKTYYEYPVGTFVADDDYGLTVDVATALDAVGGQDAKVAAMTAAVRANVDTWISTAFSAPGARAKALSFLELRNQAGADITDLQADLEDDLNPTAPNVGRLSSGSTLTQAFAANGLYRAGSGLADEALSFLLQQQCGAGFFRSTFSDAAASDQSCDAASSPEASTDTTSLAILLLQDQKANSAVSAALTKATGWLASQQAADGSYTAPFAGTNANSTGLAGWALGVAGNPSAATKAATWLRAHQLANAGSCVKFAAQDNGGIAVDDLGLTNAAPGPLSDIDNDAVTRATSQALPALLWAPGGAKAGETTLSVADDFVPAGSTQNVTITGAPGDTVCATAGGAGTRIVLPASGTATYAFTLPTSTAAVTVSTVDAGGEADSVKVTGLTAGKIKANAPKKIAQGKKFKVKVTGFAPGEPVTVKYRGKKKQLTANGKGVLRVKLKATKVGKSKVKVTGALSSRKDKVTVTVVK